MWALCVLLVDLVEVFGGEGERAGEHLVEDDAEGEDIGALVDVFAFGLFGGHIGEGAEDDPGGGEFFGVLGVFGEAEVEEFDEGLLVGVVQEHDVVGFEVTVDDADLMGFCEGVGELAKDGEGEVWGEWSLFELLLEGDPFEDLGDHELCDQDVVLFVFAVAVDLHMVGAFEFGEDLYFAVEAIAQGLVGDFFVEFEGDGAALVLFVFFDGAVDGAHPPSPEPFADVEVVLVPA